MADENKAPVAVLAGNTVVDVYQQEKPFVTYNFATSQGGIFKPFFHPIMGPNHWPITQNGEFPGTLRGHFWHHALFVGHQRIGHKTNAGSASTSFWEERDDCGRILHDSFDPMKAGDAAEITEKLIWKSAEGRELIRETRIITVPKAKADERILDIELRFRPAKEAIRFEKTPYNLLALRVGNSLLRLDDKQELSKKYGNFADFRPMLRGGRITNSDGKEEGKVVDGKPPESVRGERAKWVDFSGPLDNAAYGGIALMDHPMNPRYPTFWNIWNNQTIMASFTYLDQYELALDKDLKLKYRVFVHRGDAKEADVEGVWVDFGHRD